MTAPMERYVPVEPDGTSRASESSTAFMLRCLLQSRLDAGLPSDDDGNEHDVHVYLAHLLGAYADPAYCVRVGCVISPNDTTVFETAQHSTSKRFRYRVYRINADHLMMAIGVFQNPDGRRPDSRPQFRPQHTTYMDRAKTYYDFASTYSQSVFGSTSGVTGVLGKLATGFERYVRILSHLRSEYFDFVDRLSEGELYHLERSANTEGAKSLYDEFLDRYNEYRASATPEAHEKLRDVVHRLHQADPGFHFDEMQ